MKPNSRIVTPQQAEEKLIPLLKAGELVSVVVTGSSMAPFLRGQKDTVFLRTPAIQKPKRGDILFFRRTSGEFVLHRLDKILSNGTFVINGDAQSWFEIITPEQVLAVVEQISRGGKKAFSPRRLDWKMLQDLWRFMRPVRPQIMAFVARCRKR